ncbi:MAG: TrkH family potassium uptake protein, partial [Clostridiales bacterium]|nr:TrkH family potassium uptake protein [Clostridiales bacterium]
MNYRIIFNTLGKVVWAEALFLLLPLATSFIYGEACAYSFIITIIIALALGACLYLIKPKSDIVFAKEGFVIAALTWMIMSALGALPFVISGEIPSYVDALFETISGFTTTGASTVANVEAMSKGILMWRSFTHWIGGMGVLVFIVALTRKSSDRSIHILRAEMPGPSVDKLVPRSRDTAKILYLIYMALTVSEIIFLWFGEMDLFESAVHAFATAGTGGFGIKGDSIASYSAYSQWVITAFMLLFGVNFNLYFLLIARKFRYIFKSTELKVYLSITVFMTALIAINTSNLFASLHDNIRTSAFQVASILTTTGFATADFDAWSPFAKTLIFLLMFVGGCAGSTAGGMKL